MVSVLMLTYKQEAYIQKAIEGVLEQQTNFQFKLIIGDDASPDNTSTIVEKYKEKYPDKIVYIRNRENLGAIKNFINIYSLASTKYIALCEGDDYWCDVNKLQRQFDFLEANENYSICFHNVYELKENDKSTIEILDFLKVEKTFTIEDLAEGNFIHTPSVVLRNTLVNGFPNWFNEAPIGDYALHMLTARQGLIKYFPEPMAVYRIHSGGMWSLIGMEKNCEYWNKLMGLLLKEDFSAAVKEKLLRQYRRSAEKLLLLLMNEGRWNEFLTKIAIYASEDNYIATEWAIKYYPEYIQWLTNGRAYKLAKSFRTSIKKIKKKNIF
jgi:glycosyltransferase involved in cell wall biosynthesis